MALDKFQPYLFVSAGEQSNKYLTPVISPEGIASFQAQRAQELNGLTVRIDPIQSGTGEPSPTNIRPISGRTGMTVTVQSGETQNEYPVTWETEAGTIYGGTLDVVSGVLTVTHVGIRLTSTNHSWSSAGNASTGMLRYYCTLNPAADASTQEVMCSHARNVSGNATPWGTCFLYNGTFAMKNGDVGAGFSTLADFRTWLDENNLQVCYKLATPQTYQLTPTEVRTIAGFNQIYSDAGPVIDIKF